MPTLQARFWCFTLNNYSDAELQRYSELTLLPGGPNYLLFGREVGESGTPHLQGYIEFPSKKGFGAVKALLGERVHLEKRRGSQQEATDYCRKSDPAPMEFGTPTVSNQGRRSDLGQLVDELKGGASLKDVALANPELYCKYRNGLRDIANMVASEQEKRVPRNVFIWGTPGTGKSRWAHGLKPESTWIYGGSGWFDGYSGQDVAIFDDFNDDATRSGGIPLGTFLKLLDRYPLQVPIKGGFVNWNPEIIIFTANRDLSEFYQCHPGHDGGAILRRFPFRKFVNRLGQLDGWDPFAEGEENEN